MRLLAIGDVHGHLSALRQLLDLIRPSGTDQIIFLGDYADKGPNVKGVIDYLIELAAQYDVVFLRGNHDQMMIDAHDDPAKVAVWECLGGESPLASYGPGTLAESLKLVPSAHWAFLKNVCRNFYEKDEYIFVHGGIRSPVAPSDEDPERLLWTTLSLAEPHHSGRTVICGHSAQKGGNIADLGHTICIDTGITHGAWLTCLALGSHEYWQLSEEGKSRSGFLR
jgi:serine/threonine protein phosphatase 1